MISLSLAPVFKRDVIFPAVTGIAGSSDWFIALLAPVEIGSSNYSGIDFATVI